MTLTKPKPQNPEENHCENCGKALFGRTDKRFCNDTCRNTFNREKILREKQLTYDNQPEVFKIIKTNYEILRSYGELAEGSFILVPAHELKKAGFNFKYCTSAEMEENELWRYCFERGWNSSEDYCSIKDLSGPGMRHFYSELFKTH